jgi:hypothetical protein
VFRFSNEYWGFWALSHPWNSRMHRPLSVFLLLLFFLIIFFALVWPATLALFILRFRRFNLNFPPSASTPILTSPGRGTSSVDPFPNLGMLILWLETTLNRRSIKLTRSCTNVIRLVCAIIFLRQLHPSFVCVS